MNEVSRLRRPADAVAARLRLDEWLRERRIDLALPAASVDCAHSAAMPPQALESAAPLDGLPAAAKRAVRLAQVRLVRPGLAAAARDRLLYLLVLGRPARGVWMAAPFGRYTTAALPGEIERPGAPVPLRVVCLWNSRRLPDGWLRQCTFATALPAAEQRTLAAALRALKRGTPLPSPLRPLAGPPLLHPLDPRHDYLEEEREALESLVAGSRRTDIQDWIAGALPLAAEARAGYGSVRHFRSADGALRVRLLARFPSHTWLAQALNAQGGLTPVWDGWQLAGAGMLCEPLRGGETVLPADCVDAALQLVSPDGRALMLTEEGEQ